MKIIENYVCTLEQAKRLKELGIKQNSLFYYVPSMFHGGTFIIEYFSIKTEDKYAAFTSQELGELIEDIRHGVSHEIIFADIFRFFQLDYISTTDRQTEILFEIKSENEAQARAEFLIYLLEGKK